MHCVQSTEAFEICTEKQAREIDDKENLETKPRRPADKARIAKPRGTVKKAKKTRRARKTSPISESAKTTDSKNNEETESS